MRFAVPALVLALAAPALAQDQQLGARTKAMGGSYTAFEDDPVSVWLNPAGTATQPDALSVAYQTYPSYPLKLNKAPGSPVVTPSAQAETTFVDPAVIPSYIGMVFHVGPPDSGMAVGVCYARPYVLNYSFDQVEDPLKTQFEPDSNVQQSFSRFRVSFAKDFRFKPAGETGFFTHLSAGLGIDIGYERWEFQSETQAASDNATSFGAGAGLLLGLYDGGDSLRLNLGLAYQSGVSWDFNIDPDVFPAFDMPQQLNFGITAYLLEGTPLRATLDFQWIDWSATADEPFYAGQPTFEDSFNVSFGVEYRIEVAPGVSLYPRAGYRRYDAPWEDENNLPSTGTYKLLLDTDGESFNIFTFGAGLSWSNEAGKLRSVDLGADVGGDTWNFAIGINVEF